MVAVYAAKHVVTKETSFKKDIKGVRWSYTVQLLTVDITHERNQTKNIEYHSPRPYDMLETAARKIIR